MTNNNWYEFDTKVVFASNKVFDAVQDAMSTMVKIVDPIKAALTQSKQWIWGVLIGDFNEDQTTSQIVANTVLGVIPIVDQVLDVRDVIANSTKVSEDSSNKAAWIALILTVIGCIPGAGSVIKGGLKILFKTINKGIPIKKAIEILVSYVRHPAVLKVLGKSGVERFFDEVLALLRRVQQELSYESLLKNFDKLVAQMKKTFQVLESHLGDFGHFLFGKRLYQYARASERYAMGARAQIGKAFEQVGDRLHVSLKEAEKELAQSSSRLRREAREAPGVRAAHKNSDVLEGRAVLSLSRTEKGLYGEIVADREMAGRGFTSVATMPPPRDLRVKPRGRGIDGVYKNSNPPPPYVVLETKFRTGSGSKMQYIDGDGNATSELLSKTNDGTKQMSEKWIKDRLENTVDKKTQVDMEKKTYDSWLAVVDESGEVVSITKLDDKANVIGRVK